MHPGFSFKEGGKAECLKRYKAILVIYFSAP
jgi:hypothetical protein